MLNPHCLLCLVFYFLFLTSGMMWIKFSWSFSLNDLKMVNVGHMFFVCFCFRVFVFSCVCVFVFLCLELFIVCSANDECWAHCFCAAAPITTGIIVRSCFKKCRKELEDEDCATFLAILIQIYLWSEQRHDGKHAHTHTLPPRGGKLPRNMRWIVALGVDTSIPCLPAEYSHGTFFFSYNFNDTELKTPFPTHL